MLKPNSHCPAQVVNATDMLSTTKYIWKLPTSATPTATTLIQVSPISCLVHLLDVGMIMPHNKQPPPNPSDLPLHFLRIGVWVIWETASLGCRSVLVFSLGFLILHGPVATQGIFFSRQVMHKSRSQTVQLLVKPLFALYLLTFY